MQRLHHEHIVYYFIYIFSISNLLLKASINYRFNDLRSQISRISLQSSLRYKYLYSYQESERSKSLSSQDTQNLRYSSCLFQSASMFMISSISKWRIISSICKYHCLCLNARLWTEIRERFHLFYFVFVLIINENRMHAQQFAEESALLSCKRTRYFCIS